MLADDAFRAKLQSTIEALRTWSQGFADCARIDETEAADHWRLIIAPHAPAACPVELILHTTQRYDIAVGPEVYEDLPLDDPATLPPLLAAIGDGRVVTRTWRTHATGAPVDVETRVDIGDTAWAQARSTGVLSGPTSHEACEARTLHYAPYRSMRSMA